MNSIRPHRRKRVTRRNDTPTRSRRKLGSFFRPGGRPSSGIASQVVILFGCFWLVGFLGVVAWYLQTTTTTTTTHEGGATTNKRSSSSAAAAAIVGVHNLAEKLGNLRQQRQQQMQQAAQKRQVVEEETAAPGPQTGVKHIPILSPLSTDPDAYRSPLLIFTCKRANYLSQTLDDILENIGDHCAFGCPVVVSEDGYHDPIKAVMEEYTLKFQARGIPLIHMQHDQAPIPQTKLRKRQSPLNAYRALAQHYGWALSEVFHDGLDVSLPIPDRVMILEEDIHTSPDFFSYMKATSRILDEDPTLFAVSAYNDNGHMAHDPNRILRSDFFPGLGWMMNRRLWVEELEAKWPKGYWDDWLREPVQRKNRHVLRPEVSRTFHFGNKGGTSNNQFGTILSRVKLNQESIDWSQQDLSYLHEQAFDEQYGKLLAESVLASTVEDAQTKVATQNTRLEYTSLVHFQTLAAELDIMEDEKASIPRTAYKGVVEIRPFGDHLLFLTPPEATLRKTFASFTPQY